MKRIFLFVAGLLLISLSSSGAASSWMSQDAARIQQAVQEALPREALVIFVQEKEVYLDITKENGAAVGKKYVVERPGAEIKHPVTGEVLGKATTRVAEVQITWIQSGFSRAKILGTPVEGGIRVKDTARLVEEPVIIRHPIRHADGSPSKLTEAVDAELADLLSRISGASVRLGPSHYGIVSSAATMAAGFPEATLFVMGRVEGDEIEVSIVNTSTAVVVKSFRIPVPDDMKVLADEKTTPVVAATQPVAAPTVSGPSSFERIATHDSGEISVALPYVPIDLTAGDIDGDGVDEIITAENKTLHFYHIKPNGTLEEIGKGSTGWASLIFHLTACDLDGDGKAEIYVIEKPGNYVRSTAYRWTNGKLEKFSHESDVFLRALKTLGQPALYGQRYGSNRPFERGILKYRINGGKLAGTSAGLPPQVTVYDFAPLGTTGFTASIDYENKLRLYNQSGDIVWTGTDFYGGSDVKIESADKRTTIEEKTGIATADLDGDGVEELLVVQNLFEGGSSPGFIRLANIQQYKTGRIVALAFSGGALSERWKSRTFNGIIKGFTIANPLSRGQEAVFFTQEKVNFTSKRATLRVIPLR